MKKALQKLKLVLVRTINNKNTPDKNKEVAREALVNVNKMIDENNKSN